MSERPCPFCETSHNCTGFCGANCHTHFCDYVEV